MKRIVWTPEMDKDALARIAAKVPWRYIANWLGVSYGAFRYRFDIEHRLNCQRHAALSKLRKKGKIT